MTIYLEQPGELAAELSETLTQCTTVIVLKFLASTLNLLSQASQSTSRV